MRNILDQAPSRDLHGIQAHAVRLVAEEDLADRVVLDVGCGFGWFELYALDHGVRRVIGIEPDDRELETARRHIHDERATFTVGRATDLPVPDESVDTVVCWEVLEHLSRGDEPAAFVEIRRVLRPGGALYLSTPYASWRARALDPAWWLLGHRHYRLDRLERFARDAGLEPQLIEKRGRGWQIVAILNLYVAKWIFRRPPFFEAAVARRWDEELRQPGGYANCFLKAHRPYPAAE
jgi:SAM-dependent methyltransferase